jgi:hypothetical protein
MMAARLFAETASYQHCVVSGVLTVRSWAFHRTLAWRKVNGWGVRTFMPRHLPGIGLTGMLRLSGTPLDRKAASGPPLVAACWSSGLGGGLDLAECLPDAAAELLASGDGQFGDAVDERAPAELVGLGQQCSGGGRGEVVSPGCLVPAGVVVDGGERE